MPKIDDLVAYLHKKGTFVEQINKHVICFEQKFYLDDGSSQNVKLEVHSIEDKLLVKAANDRFPNFCPTRHINYGGFFCIGLDSDIEKLSIKQWIVIVQEFLVAQHECEISKKWPTKQWAHGDGAIFQSKVEEHYLAFKKNLLGITLDDLQVNEIDIKGKVLYHIYFNGNLILIGNKEKVLNKRYSCICDTYGLRKHRSIGKCSSKCAQIIYTVAINDFLRAKAEQEFWDSFISSGKVECCKSMKDCELNCISGGCNVDS